MPPEEINWFDAAVARIARDIADAGKTGRMTMGDAAALRRLEPGDVHGRYLLALARAVPPGVALSDTDEAARWAAIVNALALARGAHNPRHATGTALSAMNLTENRVAALLAADATTLRDLVARIARRAAAAGQAMDWRPLARLLRDAGDRPRGQRRSRAAAHRRPTSPPRRRAPTAKPPHPLRPERNPR